MRFILKKVVEVEVETLRAKLEPRYWEDASVGGIREADEAPTIPLRDGRFWRLDIDLATGRIAGWPPGVCAKTHYKVCDAGVYSLLDPSGEEVARKEGYVPSMLSPIEDGFGDYVILDIDGDGVIAGWSVDLDWFEDAVM